MARRLGLVALLGALAFAVIRLTAANAAPVDVDLLLVRVPNLPLWQALAASFALGAALCGVLTLVEVLRSALVNRRYRKTVEHLESELHQLRNLPLASSLPDRLPEARSQAAAPAPVRAGGSKPAKGDT